ncbi:hypothetical protein EJK17_03295 [Lactobacillus xujianguonis]|uniref:Nudix hydrolase domain-containing protein n=1 Tax=Lactobacillus xujianguonis TaxID=2495899 RepID=A0A437SWD8_9LACO|nr:hypothetical protein [Lactobacillus xujianguonis]RVU71234.1 hypothetical protein EJK17_03295 [Lactobacillus xujianguonis]
MKKAIIVAPSYLGKYLLFKIESNGKIRYEFSKGLQKNNESLFVTALKTLKEQTNLKPNISIQLKEIMFPATLDMKVLGYLTEVEDASELHIKGNRKYKWVTFQELKELVANGQIIDSLTLSVICKIFCTRSYKKIKKLRL